MIEHTWLGDLYTESCRFYLFNKFELSCIWYTIIKTFIYEIIALLIIILIFNLWNKFRTGKLVGEEK